MRRFLRMGVCAKLEPIFFGPFEILDRVGPVTYKLAFPPIVKAHNVFHVFLYIYIYIHYATHVID
jgi:hypothetical protein